MYRTKQQRKSPLQRWAEKNKTKLPIYVLSFLLLTFYLAGIINQLTKVNFISEEKTKYTFEIFKCIKIGITGEVGGIFLMLIFWSVVAYRIYMRNKDLTSRDLKDDSRGYQTDEWSRSSWSVLIEAQSFDTDAKRVPRHAPHGACGLKFPVYDPPERTYKSRSAQSVWIEADRKSVV